MGVFVLKFWGLRDLCFQDTLETQYCASITECFCNLKCVCYTASQSEESCHVRKFRTLPLISVVYSGLRLIVNNNKLLTILSASLGKYCSFC